jgi:putative sterol carrier protein
MSFYANTDELNKVMQLLWQSIKDDKTMADQLIASKLIVQFSYREPESYMVVDCSDGKNMNIKAGEPHPKPIVEMSMKADTAHEFWMGKLSIPVALITGKIVSKGPTPKALALLPVIKPAFAIYPKILEKIGKPVS